MMVKTLFAILAAPCLLLSAAGVARAQPETLEIERLSWAGIRMVAGDTTVFIDAVGTEAWDGMAAGGLVPVEASTSRRYALITHLHNDHFDEAALKAVLGDSGYVVCHEAIATQVASRGLRVIPAKLYEPVRRDGFVFTAVPAEDGFGAEQVSWIVAWEGHRYLHAGDTLWHGKWDLIGAQYGPFDAVFLPINGARIQRDPQSETPGIMTPAQAVDAAVLLRAALVVPIHYGGNHPPDYVEVAEPLAVFRKEAARRGVAIDPLQPGESLKP
jgi:L-ascorbate metabolism protein UlaG (beta-lactamase superfamily)